MPSLLPIVRAASRGCLLFARQAGGTPSCVKSHILTQKKAGAIHSTVFVPTMEALSARSKQFQRKARDSPFASEALHMLLLCAPRTSVP